MNEGGETEGKTWKKMTGRNEYLCAGKEAGWEEERLRWREQ